MPDLELPQVFTHATAEEVAEAFLESARSAGLKVTAELLAVLLGQSALETGNWTAMTCWNFGNVKATEARLASGGHFVYFDKTQPGSDAPVTENMSPAQAVVALRLSRPRPGGEGPDMIDKGPRADGRHYCLFWARHPEARFRAFDSLRAGAQVFLNKLSGKYAPALIPAGRGDIHGYIAELQRVGPYFTADAAAYQKIVEDRYRHYLPLAQTTVQKTMPNTTATKVDPFAGYRQYPELGALVSRLEDLVAPGDDGFVELPSGVHITKRAIQDRATGGLGRPEHNQVLPWLEAHGLRIASPEELEDLHEQPATIFLEPLTLPTAAMRIDAGVPPVEGAIQAYRGARMRSERWCRLTDDTNKRRLAEAGYTGTEAVSGECKFWTTPTAPGKLPRIIGWWLKKQKPEKIQDLSDFHGTDPKMSDYGTGFRAVKIVRRQEWLVGFDGVEPSSIALAHRCLLWTGFQFGLGVKEIPGAKHNPAILEFSKHCRRGGHFLGVDAGGMPLWENGARLSLATDEEHWCAAAASSALLNALMAHEVPPHGLRVSVAELAADAKAAGTLRPVDWTPSPGSLAIEGRAGENPLNGGKGHVRRVVLVEDARYSGIGGNEGNTFGVGWYPRTGELRADGHKLVGWIEV